MPNDKRPLALITGASSGIGATFARELAARGYDLILVARRRDLLNERAAELGLIGASVEVLAADLTLDEDLARVESRIAESELSLLINNAGFGTIGLFPKTKLEGQDKMHRLHVMATMRLTHAALRGMVVRDRGAVINVSSVAAFGTSPGNVSYCATKAWMNSFTIGLANELAVMPSKVRVQALCPGFTRSSFHDAMGADKDKIPKSLWTSAEHVVRSSLAGLETGKVIVVPGWKYKLFVGVSRFLPNGLTRWVNVRAGRRMRRI